MRLGTRPSWVTTRTGAGEAGSCVARSVTGLAGPSPAPSLRPGGAGGLAAGDVIEARRCAQSNEQARPGIEPGRAWAAAAG
jgi:hypothetical protein